MPESFDFVTADPGSGGANLAGDTFTQVSDSLFVPACYLVYGPAGGPYTRVDSGDGLPVEIQGTVPVSGTFWQATQPVSIASTLTVTGAGGTFPVTDSGGSLTVDGTVAATQSGTWTVTGAGGTFPVTDGGGSLTVDGTVAITGSVTVTGGLTNTELRSTAVVVDGSGVTQPVSGTFWQATQPVSAASLPLPSGASTAAKQPALGTAGTPSADVLTVQGVSSMTPFLVNGSGFTQPVSGTFWQATQPVSVASTVTVTGAGGTFPVTDSGGSLTVDGTVAATQSGTWTVTGAGGTFPVTDGGGSLTVDGTVAISGSVAVTGGLTNTELRSTAVVVDGSGVTQPVSGTFWQATQPVSGTFWQATQPVSGPLTDAELRATPVPVSGSVTTGGLTNTELRSTAVVVDGSGVTQPVSGTFWQATQPVSGTVGVSSVGGSVAVTGTFWQVTQPVSGPLTDAQLRATPVPVSGTVSTGGLTNTELRSSAVVVDGSGVTQPVSGTFWQATQPVSGTVTVQDGGGSITVDGTVAVSSVGGSVAVTGTFWQATQPVSIANTVTVTGAGGTFPVTDSGGSLTVDGTVAATQSGTWAVSGPEAKDAAATANPLYLAGYGSTATPSSVSSDGDITPLWVTRYGALWTVDVGAGISATPADGYSAGSMPPHMSFGMLFNGTTWDRARSVNTGQARATLYDASGNAIFPTPAALSDTASNPTTVMLSACEQAWDPTNAVWARKQAHDSRNLIASGPYTTTTASATQTNRTGLFCMVQCHVSSAGTGTLQLRLLGRTGGNYYEVLAYVSITGAGLKTIIYGPGCSGTGTAGLTSAANSFVAGFLPREWYVDVVPSDGSSWTYRVDVDTI